MSKFFRYIRYFVTHSRLKVWLMPPLFVLSIFFLIPHLGPDSDYKVPISLVTVAALVFIGVTLLSYLSPMAMPDDVTLNVDDKNIKHFRQLLKNEMLLAGSLELHERHALVEVLTKRINEEATSEIIAEMRKELQDASIAETVHLSAEGTIRRIYREIDALGRRGSLNLVLGVMMALAGIGLLAYMVLAADQQCSSLGAFAMAFLPRLSIVAIVELFSYFFLRLYKSSLSEIKYFQNEATNIESKLLALRVALQLKAQEETKNAIGALLLVERNGPLHAGVTTRELEEAKLFKDPMTVSIQTLVEIIRALPQKRE